MIDSQRLKTHARRALWIIGLLLIGLPIAWTAFTLHWAYSEGERAGVLQKFSHKGWICKTYEGELAQYVASNMAPQIWYFTVRDEAVAEQLNRLVGSKVQLHYAEHRGVPSSCFGDTGYYVTGATLVDQRFIPGQ